MNDIFEISKEYLGGFIDGDGTISTTNNSIYVSIGQCDIRPLYSIQRKYGGIIRQRQNKENQRTLYVYTLNKREQLIDLVNDILSTSIIKYLRFKKAKECLEENNSKKFKILTEELKLLQSTSILLKPNFVIPRLTDQYLSGFTDAEGYIANSIVGLTQKHVQFNILLQQNIENSYLSADKYRLNIYSKEHIELFLNRIKSYCIVKNEQIDYLIQILNIKKKNKGNTYTKDIQEQISKLEKQLSIMKHTSQNILKEEILNKNDESKLNNHFEKISNRYYEPNRKFGEDNHRYGIEMNIDVKVKIAIKNSKSKRTVTDEQIDLIRDFLLENTLSQEEIAELFEIDRSTVSLIKLNKLVKTTEFNEDNIKENIIKKKEKKENQEKLSNEEKIIEKSRNLSKGKRQFEKHLIIDVLICKKNNQYTSVDDIRNILQKQRIELSKPQINNILVGKTLLFEDEFPINNINYIDYNELLEEVKQISKNTNKIMISIKKRTITPNLILDVLYTKYNDKKLSYNDISNKLNNILNKEQVRAVFRQSSKIYECEFPINYNNNIVVTYEKYIELLS
jgi:predicted XRE-type DNA-binding protein